jgi:hypothetical protein
MTKQDLIKEIDREITQSCALPYSLKPDEVERIIDRAAAWAYDNYQYSLEEKIIVIPAEAFKHASFIKTRQIQLPDCFMFVYDVRELVGIGIIGQQMGDFSDSKLLGAEIFLSPFQGDNLIYRTAMYSYFDLAKAYLLETVAHRWNKNTKRFTVIGRNPVRDVGVRGGVKIPEESLYDDELFMRYCFAKAKIQLGRTLQVFNYNLPGGITINFDAIKQDGQAEMDAILEQVKGENTPDWFLQWN